MSALDDEIRDLLRFAAERAILPRYRNLADGHVMEKAANDLVTIADHETEEFLTEALRRLAPAWRWWGKKPPMATPPCWIA